MSDATPPDVQAKGRWFGTEILLPLLERYPADPNTGEMVDLTDSTVDRWWAEFGSKAEPILLAARDAYLRPTNSGRAFPTIIQFRRYVEHAETASQREARPGACIGGCDGGFVRTEAVHRGSYVYDNQVRPCQHCRPDQALKHQREWAPRARHTVPVQPDATLDFNPLLVVQRTRALLHAQARPHYDPTGHGVPT